MPYHTRPMHIQDLSAVVDVCLDAYQDTRVTRILWPGAATHRHQLRAFWSRGLRSIFRARGMHSLVTVWRDLEGGSKEDVAAVVFWHRTGPASDPTVRAWQATNDGWDDVFERFLLGLEERYAAWTRADAPGSDLELRRRSNEANHHCETKWARRYPEQWHLDLVAVPTRHQRKGLAGHLIRWGTDLAAAEGVPATLLASEAGQALYERYGFVTVDIAKTADGSMVFNPWMVYEPENLRPEIPKLADMEDVREFQHSYQGERFQ